MGRWIGVFVASEPGQAPHQVYQSFKVSCVFIPAEAQEKLLI